MTSRVSPLPALEKLRKFHLYLTSQLRAALRCTSGSLGMKIGIHFGNVAWFPVGAKIHLSHKNADSAAK
jgi:hypothetical protein